MIERLHNDLMKKNGILFKKGTYKFYGQRLVTVDGNIIRVYNNYGYMDSLINVNRTSYEIIMDTIERNLLRFINAN